MSNVAWVHETLIQHANRPAIVWREQETTYDTLVDKISDWRGRFGTMGIRPGQVVAIKGDYNPEVCALFIALVLHHTIVVPLSPTAKSLDEFVEIAECDVLLDLDGAELCRTVHFERGPKHELLARLQLANAPGLILFSSGSTGKSKASVLDLSRMLARFKGRSQVGSRTITFLLLDHIGGVNTLFHVLLSGGVVVPIRDRSADAVCAAVAQHRVALLPTTPTFINMLIMSGAYLRHDLSSLEMITYGTEPMPAATLKHLAELFPNVTLKQTYGLSELGILQTKSRSSDSLWVKLGGPGFELKVVDGILWIRSESAMLGYLNASAPFTDDGWFITGDAVEVDGEYFRILGRKSEMVNVGGEKVYPAEVESVILELPNIVDVTVSGKRNAITGQVVVAKVVVKDSEPSAAVSLRVRQHCRERLLPFKVPAVVEVTEESLHSERFKKRRAG